MEGTAASFRREERLIIAGIAIIVNSGLQLLGPLIVGFAIDNFVEKHDFHGLIIYSIILFIVYVLAFGANFVQMRTMGAVGQRLLFKLRNSVFTKLQELPVAFFNQNKAGDLISRLNNDTDKLNQLFSQTLMQFSNSVFIIIGAGIFILAINFKLALVSLVPTIFLLIFAEAITPWIKEKELHKPSCRGRAFSRDPRESWKLQDHCRLQPP